MKLFKESEKSTFAYWFAHWCAFQMVALDLHVWKPRFLLHDIEKPWLMLLWNDYPRVKQWHRNHANHHLSYPIKNKIDWEAMAIDWECSRFTKESAQLNARDSMEYEKKKYPDMALILEINLKPVLDKLGL